MASVGKSQAVHAKQVWHLSITQSRLVKSINRNVMLLQQFLPAIRQIPSGFFIFSRIVARRKGAWNNQLFATTFPTVELFQKFFENRLSSVNMPM